MTTADPGTRAGSGAAVDRARLEYLTRFSPVVTYCLQPRPPYRPTFVSENVEKMYGVTAAELLGRAAEPFADRRHPDDAGAAAAGRRRVLAEGRSRSEYRLRGPDGSWRWARDEQALLRDDAGRPLEIAGSLLDITERRRTEERAERLQQLTAGLAAALTPEQVAASALLPALSVLEAQGVGLILRDFGADPPRLVVAGVAGYPPEVVEPWRRLPLDDSTPAGRAVLTGAPVYLSSAAAARDGFPELFAATDPAGERAWAAVPLVTAGAVVGALAVGFNFAHEFPAPERRFLETVAAQCALAVERTRLYGSAAAEQERLAAVLAQLPVGVIIAEAPSGRLMLGNAEVQRIWRHPFRASAGIAEYGDAYLGFHPGDGRPYAAQEWPLARSLIAGEVVDGEEVDFERGDGTRGTIVVNSAPIRDRAGVITGAVCTFVDVTGRSEAQRTQDRAYAAERAARAAAEAAGERLGRLQQITAGLAEALTVEEVAAVMVRGGLSVAASRSAWIGVLDETGEALVVLAASFPVEPGGPAARIPLDAASPRAEVTRTGQSLWIPSAAEALSRFPGLAAIGIADGALGVVPLVSHGRPIGAMMLSFADERTFDADERNLITLLAEQCAQALERARLHQRAADVALALQQSMLPSALPLVPGLELAARYLPAVDSLEVGGDWYDVVVRPDGRVALAVGDVVGRGLGAATTMGQLRSALAALALSEDSPAAVLDGLERFARQVEGARLATVAYGVLDPVGGVLHYACAGHPPPLVLRGADGAELLEDGRSSLLCALPPALAIGPRAEGTAVLEPGDRLLLFSDGLVERRRESLSVGLDRLAEQAVAVGSDPGWPDELLRRMLHGAGDDDVALLGVAYEPLFEVRVPARAEGLAKLRRQLRRWLAAADVDDDTASDVLLACGEAAANAVEHAFAGTAVEPGSTGPAGEHAFTASAAGPAGEFEVELRIGAGRELTLRVSDTGRWRQVPAPGDRGRGLPMMRAVMDSVDVESGQNGTVITMRRRLGVRA